MRRCFECKAGEHENYDDDIVLTIIKDPINKKIFKKGYMCHEHRMMYLDDGFIVIEKGKKND